MLEQPGLQLVVQASNERGAAGQVVRVSTLDGQTPMGSASWLRSPGRLLNWFALPMLEVREADDEPLLLTLQRQWGLFSRWLVQDAEERKVGRICRGEIRDRSERQLAQFRCERDRSQGTFCTQDDLVMALVQREPDVLRLTFAEDLSFHPFHRMLLLASALTLLLEVA